MPIPEIEQPSVLQVDEQIRLRSYDGIHDFALSWYQDVELIWLVDGDRKPYDTDRLNRMYRYLNEHGELYFIEVLENGSYRPIGDVTFWQQDMPIVIAEPAWRGKGVGKKIIAALVERGRALGYDKLYVDEIYHYNIASRRCFESVGFRAYEETEKGVSFVLELCSH